MSSRIPYPLHASSSAIDPRWAQDQYGWAYEVLSASGIDHEDTRWKFATTEHGLHPLTYHGWWMFVVYYDNKLGVVVDPERMRTLRSAYPEGSVEVCGQSINDLMWVLFDTKTVALEEIQKELRHSIRVLQSSKAVNPRDTPNALILLWNPDNWDWPNFKELVAASLTGQPVNVGWKVKNPHLVHVGMPVYIYRTGTKGRGFMASGSVVSPPYVTAHFQEEEKQQTSVDVILDTLIDPSSDIPMSLDKLNEHLASVEQVSNFLHSGVVLRAVAADRLQSVWLSYVHTIRGVGPQLGSIPDSDAEYFYSEGALRQLSLNSHERSGPARERAIHIHGTDCCVCGMNFERMYGEIGKGFIHIHHLDPLANATEHRPVDPRKDLVPVCPNCHAMLHRGQSKPLAPDELKRILTTMNDDNNDTRNSQSANREIS